MPNKTSLEYALMCKDTPLLYFDYILDWSMTPKTPSFSVEIRDIIQENNYLLPVGLVFTDDAEEDNTALYKWLITRRMPSNRRNYDVLMDFIGAKNDPLSYIRIGRGLSLNDAYWIKLVDDPIKWDDCNLYTASFDPYISDLAFSVEQIRHKLGASKKLTAMLKKAFGQKINTEEKLLLNKHIYSPEFVTNGYLRKCWVRDTENVGMIRLLKAVEQEHIFPDRRSVITMEFYAAQVAEVMGFDRVSYDLQRYEHPDGTVETVCSCPMFTSEDIEYVPAIDLLKSKSMELYKAHLVGLSETEDYQRRFADLFGYDSYADLMVFDSLILNRDRHLYNFGWLRDTNTGEYLMPAPIFDNGMSWFVLTGRDLTRKTFAEYLEHDSANLHSRHMPFDELARIFVKERHREGLERLLNFSLKQPKEPGLGVTENALEAISEGIKTRAKQILRILDGKDKTTGGRAEN